MKTNKKPKKKRAKNYESKLKIDGTFLQAIKTIVKDKKVKQPKKK